MCAVGQIRHPKPPAQGRESGKGWPTKTKTRSYGAELVAPLSQSGNVLMRREVFEIKPIKPLGG